MEAETLSVGPLVEIPACYMLLVATFSYQRDSLKVWNWYNLQDHVHLKSLFLLQTNLSIYC
jgi:hypothetical protein